jgi:mRNA interferase YafQ
MEVIDLLLLGDPLPEKNRDHALRGNWAGWLDCNLEPDWVLIYKVVSGGIILGRTGTHADLF